MIFRLFFLLSATKIWDSEAFSRDPSKISLDSLAGRKVLVVGGSGRVGGSCVTQLVKNGSRVVVGGTNSANFKASQDRWILQFPSFQLPLREVLFEELDRENSVVVSGVLEKGDFDLVINTAGPFQGKVNVPNGVIDACVNCGVPYIDVADDYCTASAAKSKYATKAIETKTPCIVSTGCWPGVSSLMAKQLLRKVVDSYPDTKPEDMTVKFSFFTAGSGGAGVTLLVATFLILAEKALMVVNGRRTSVNPMEAYSTVNFGPIVGDREVSHLNLLETASVADLLGAGNVQSLFGTAPGFWNSLLGIMGKLPTSVLENEDLMRKLSIFSIPIVRVVDYFAGATNAMRCDVTCKTLPGVTATAIYAHENLEPCVGECVAAFSAAVLSDAVRGGVWFPEEAIRGGADAAAVLQAASVGAHTSSVSSEGVQALRTEIWGSKSEK